MKNQKISDQISEIELKQKISQNQLNQIIYDLPNIANDDVPIGKDEKSNKIIKKLEKLKISLSKLNLTLS